MNSKFGEIAVTLLAIFLTVFLTRGCFDDPEQKERPGRSIGTCDRSSLVTFTTDDGRSILLSRERINAVVPRDSGATIISWFGYARFDNVRESVPEIQELLKPEPTGDPFFDSLGEAILWDYFWRSYEPELVDSVPEPGRNII